MTSVMAGLYLIGFAAPAFEAAACHVGETIDPNRNVPRAMLASARDGGAVFRRPARWSGSARSVRSRSAGDLAQALGPTFAPLLGGGAKAAAIWFMMFNMFHGTLAAARRRGAHAVAARRGRPAAADARPSARAPTCPGSRRC